MTTGEFFPTEYQQITLVAALDRGGIIGAAGTIPWHLPDDLRFFKRVTLGKPVIMGRKTFESIGRPLPGRVTIILTRQSGYRPAGCLTAGSVSGALAVAGRVPEIMVAGGAEIYRLFLPLAYRLYLTRIAADVAGDTYFPDFDRDAWREILRERHRSDERHDYDFDIIMSERAQ